jgi:NhaA family Na+:H+ antiporter
MKKKNGNLFKEFFEGEKSGGFILIFVTFVSLIIANSAFQNSYLEFWQKKILGLKIELWVNDVLMSIFFLLIGLELKREFTSGELSDPKKATLPFVSALGGILVPAGIYLFLNWNSETQSGFGIPMATDIAFAIGVLSLLGKRIPLSIKIFLTALAVIDDLAAILVIAFFYSKGIAWIYLLLALLTYSLLYLLNKLKVKNLLIYLLLGIVLWYFMHHSGIHATISGVLLALTIPATKNESKSTAGTLQDWLDTPVPFIILPLFAMANTAIQINPNWNAFFSSNYTLGIFFGLVFGKPIGIALFTFIFVKTGICKLPSGSNWKQLIAVSFLGGIGFTMSIFVSLLAFNDSIAINNSKLMIMISSLTAGIIGIIALIFATRKT